MVPRSYLFVPANRPERVDKALASGADSVIIDLEDAVAPFAKDSARASLVSWLQSNGEASVVVRINAGNTSWFKDDLSICALPGIAAIMVSKAEGIDVLNEVREAAPGRGLLPLVESAAGYGNLGAIAATAGVTRLAFGSIDFQLDLDIGGEGEELLYFRSHLVLVSRIAGLQAPIDGVTAALDNESLTRSDASRARRLGFGGKLCIHPKQVATVNECFSPNEADAAWARRVVHAADQSAGAAVALDGSMIDKPILQRALAILQRI